MSGAPRGNLNNGIAALHLKLHEYRSAITSFAVLNGGALIFLWVSRATQFHQLAIGIMMSAIVLTLALAAVRLNSSSLQPAYHTKVVGSPKFDDHPDEVGVTASSRSFTVRCRMDCAG